MIHQNDTGTGRETLRDALRRHTHGAHERVDAAMSRLDLAREPDYARFLLTHARVLPGVERRLSEAGPECTPPDWPLRRRTDALLGDLRAMRLDPPAPMPVEIGAGAMACAGAAYVLEGSRLGGAVLARGVAGHLPKGFLEHGTGDRLWPRFVAWLGSMDADGADRATAVEAARKVFGAYEEAAMLAAAECA